MPMMRQHGSGISSGKIFLAEIVKYIGERDAHDRMAGLFQAATQRLELYFGLAVAQIGKHTVVAIYGGLGRVSDRSE